MGQFKSKPPGNGEHIIIISRSPLQKLETHEKIIWDIPDTKEMDERSPSLPAVWYLS